MEKYKIPFAKPQISDGDIEAIKNVLILQDKLTDGKQCRKFEEDFGDYIGAKYCLAVSSCMAALHLSYLALGIGEEDEVICPSMSHVATAHAIELVGARPIFVDCDSYGNIDNWELERYITNRTKAISLVHFLGQPCNMDKIRIFARDYGLSIIEDCALALGTKWEDKHVGTTDIGCFSFYSIKHITTCEGGMFVTKHKYIYDRAKRIARFGKKDWSFYNYDIADLGLNYRMSEMQAALGISQLERFPKNLKIRERNYQILESNLDKKYGNVKMFFGGSYGACLLLYNDIARHDLFHYLRKEGIEASVYYPQPINRFSYYQEKYGFQPIKFPNAISIAHCSITLPVGSHLSEDDMDYMVEKVKKGLGI